MPSSTGSVTAGAEPAGAYVVDAGVFLRWHVDQVGFEHAREVRDAFVDGSLRLLAPDFVRVEHAEVVRKVLFLRGHVDSEGLGALARSLDDLGVELHPLDADRVERAAVLAARHSLRFYDAVYAVLALDTGLELLTSDARLARALVGSVPVQVLRGIG